MPGLCDRADRDAPTICGIAGLYTHGRAVARATVSAMCDAIRHRGPDDEGVLVDGDFGMGMRRLAIIDVVASRQPVRAGDDALVLNGEIYNFRRLRAELIALGHVFTTEGDAEVALVAWREWGAGAWARLDGMFAIALWEGGPRRLTLVRDQIGIKPLYYAAQPAGIAFGSELKALRGLPGFAFDADPRAMRDYFAYGHVRGSRSIYRGVATLAPGHLVAIERDGTLATGPYDTPALLPDDGASAEEWTARFRERWLATVADQMAADVPLGAFLSGGVDSSAVVAAMRQVSNAPLKTFAIGFSDPRYDERAHAAAVAHHLGCDHVSQVVELADAAAVLPEVAACYDEPFADPSAVPTWHLSKLAAQHVKVALSGDGGDELFYGYRRHATERAVGRVPWPVRRFARPVAGLAPQRWRGTVSSAGHECGVARFLAKNRITHAHILSGDVACLTSEAREYFPDPLAISADSLDQFAFADLTLNLPAAMLTKVDRASMAHSLEVRVPMLGRGMVALAMAMPARVKLANGVGKAVVRRAIAPWLPPATTTRAKQGFRVPLSSWFRGDFGAYARELWQGGAATDGVFDNAAVARLFDEHRTGRRDHGRVLYALAIWCLWRDREQSVAKLAS